MISLDQNKPDYIKLPRLYVDQDLRAQLPVTLAPATAHYLRNVLRRRPGDWVRLFNGRDGEWLAALRTLEKTGGEALPETLLSPQPADNPAIHLVFAPIKKARIDLLLEKATELGASHLHPVLTEHCEARKINLPRAIAQLREAAEQCERLTVPEIAPLATLTALLADWPSTVPLFACIERAQATSLDAALRQLIPASPVAILIGPEGGFSAAEIALLADHHAVRPVTLGPRVLRSETAALAALALIGARQS